MAPVKIDKKTQVILHDLLMSVLAWQFSWWARFNFTFPFENWEISLFIIPLVIIVQVLVFIRFRLYRGIWRFASIPDLWNIFRASIIGALSITLICFIFFRLEGIPRSILILYPFFLMFFLGAPRLGYRVWKDHSFSINTMPHSKRVLVIGAGRAAEMLVREIIREGSYIPVGLLDDNPQIKSSEIHGIRVLGNIGRVKDVCEKNDIDIILIAIPSANGTEMREIVEQCESTNLPIKTLPGIQDMVSVTEALPKLREVSIEDLLGREKIELDWKEVQKDLANKTILVTGGGGSIGSELCYQITKLGPSKLIIFERSEFNLYKIEQLLCDSSISIEFVLGDLCDIEKVDYVLKNYSPEIIFHAAAYKHVPILEREAREAVRNNILGTKNIADIANKHGCERFILISTDKAVNPTNVLGATKRIAEQYIEILSKNSKTKFLTVRFGNVLGSDGSVVPLFKEQINKGGPITVTHPEVTRYFMTIREACQLIVQASKMGKGGEIFVLDMGEPVKINYLAEQMIRLSGLIPNKDINIEYSGLRPGEKMYEELFYENEIREKTSHDKILLAKHSVTELKELNDRIDEIFEELKTFDNDNLRALLKKITPSIEDNVISFNQL
ncbi:MAG: polysaccharide biosynthesis protein [Proteobacteria bacterium]|nr:polysaccharide biosynthesis protein [Pseudomonadota bacterium]NOG59118.1 polysaccharide biosynthesis protein [Pseudomonadota bacterium]